MFKINGLNWQLDPDTYYSIKGVYGFSRILIKERRWLKILFEKELLLCSFGNFYIIGYRLKTTYCIVNIASFGVSGCGVSEIFNHLFLGCDWLDISCPLLIVILEEIFFSTPTIIPLPLQINLFSIFTLYFFVE
jgi:hypothetical protein